MLKKWHKDSTSLELITKDGLGQLIHPSVRVTELSDLEFALTETVSGEVRRFSLSEVTLIPGEVSLTVVWPRGSKFDLVPALPVPEDAAIET
jgi:hypothetical protein